MWHAACCAESAHGFLCTEHVCCKMHPGGTNGHVLLARAAASKAGARRHMSSFKGVCHSGATVETTADS